VFKLSTRIVRESSTRTQHGYFTVGGVIYDATMPTAPSLPLVGLDMLERAIRQSWGWDTSFAQGWTSTVPSAGQCAVTALLVQDHLGGELLNGKVGGVSHYWNRLPDGVEVDFTREQFQDFAVDDARPAFRSHVLSSADAVRRYELLRARVETVLDAWQG